MTGLGPPLPEAFFRRDALALARDLLGRVLVRDEVALRITEVEAYRGAWDSASHSRAGPTARNAAMWGPAGRAYVYRCYGLHHLFNVVADSEGVGAAVLVRAAEPLDGLEQVRARRGGLDGPALLTGPGKVGQALALDPSWSHHPLFEAGGLWIAAGEPVADVIVGPRVGVDYAAPEHRDAPWRLAVAGSRWVSHRRGLALSPGAAGG